MTIRFDAAIPQFTVPDVVRTAEYYRDVLGFHIAGYWDGEQVSLDPDTAPVFGIVWRDSVRVFFSRAEQSDVRTGRAQGAYDAGFQIIGVDALAAELRAGGADILDGPDTRLRAARARGQRLQRVDPVFRGGHQWSRHITTRWTRVPIHRDVSHRACS